MSGCKTWRDWPGRRIARRASGSPHEYDEGMKPDRDVLRFANFLAVLYQTVEKLFVDFVSSLAGSDKKDAHEEDDSAVAQLARTFQTMSRPLGGKGYTTRDELYER